MFCIDYYTVLYSLATGVRESPGFFQYSFNRNYYAPQGLLQSNQAIKGECKMRLSSPKQLTWIVALILALLGLVGELGVVDALSSFAFWLAFVAAALLLLATYIKDL
jgi:hypothetical protein